VVWIRFALTALVACTPWALAAPAAADHPGFGAGTPGEAKPEFDEDAVPSRLERALGGEVEAAPGGAYRVDLGRGPDAFTHGPDPVTPVLSGGDAPRGDPFAARVADDPARPPVCATSSTGDYYQHVIYMRPSGAPDRWSTVVDDIREEIAQMNFVLNRDSLASGGPTADYKVLCTSTGQIIVSNVVSSAPATFSGVTTALRAQGFNKPNVDYTVFYDGDPVVPQCGVGAFYPNSERLEANNPNNLGNAHAITWVDCWDGLTPQHENGHNQGAVGYHAPFSTGDGAHCFQDDDVMCYRDGGNLDPGFLSPCPNPAAGGPRFDCGFDTYFDSAVEANEPYLDNHWNLGSPLNRFIAFGVAEPDNQEPTAAFAHSCEGLRCRFTDTSSDDGEIVGWSWEWGDGSSPTAQRSPAHDFPHPGTFPVRLMVTDDHGASRSVEIPITVADGAATRLRNGFAQRRAATPQGTFDRFRFKVGRKRKRLVVSTVGEPCRFLGGETCVPDLDLYLARGFSPDEGKYVCRPFLRGISERCVVRSPRKGTWRIAVHNFAAAPGTEYSILARLSGRRR
jgi:PKD repeat protein